MVLQIFNDFLVDLQIESMGRLLPQAMLPIWDMDLTVVEMSRLLDKGIRGFTLSDKPELLGLPELPDEYFAPMWEIFNESGVAVNFHIGAGRRREDTEEFRRRFTPGGPTNDSFPISSTVAQPTWSYLGLQRTLAVMATQSYMSNVRIIANLCMSDLFDRYPNLKVVSVESGIGWIPFVLEALEYQFDEMVTKEVDLEICLRGVQRSISKTIFMACFGLRKRARSVSWIL